MRKNVCTLLFFAFFLYGCTEKSNGEPVAGEIPGGNETPVETAGADIPGVQKPDIVKYVNASAGLRVRSSPDLNAQRIGVLDNLTEVRVMEEDGNSLNIDGIEGKWTLVESGNILGWVFGGYLSVEPLEATEQSSPNIIADNVRFVTIDDVVVYFTRLLNLDTILTMNNTI